MISSPMRFPRSLDSIIRDMERESSPDRYDRLLDEWSQHPTVLSQQAEYDAADAVVDKLDALLAEQDREALA